jgi:hypothetical protein
MLDGSGIARVQTQCERTDRSSLAQQRVARRNSNLAASPAPPFAVSDAQLEPVASHQLAPCPRRLGGRFRNWRNWAPRGCGRGTSQPSTVLAVPLSWPRCAVADSAPSRVRRGEFPIVPLVAGCVRQLRGSAMVHTEEHVFVMPRTVVNRTCLKSAPAATRRHRGSRPPAPKLRCFRPDPESAVPCAARLYLRELSSRATDGRRCARSSGWSLVPCARCNGKTWYPESRFRCRWARLAAVGDGDR